MSRRLAIYLKTFRRQHGLSQKEVAFLLGLKSDTHISRIERYLREPSVETLIACSLIFGCPAEDLFPVLFVTSRQAVRERGQKLFEDLQGNPQRVTRSKLDLLDDLLQRLSDDQSSPTL
ncbi:MULTISPECIES: helix-turn-helix transcriptional regulator [unclassified Mesorhizobium]|uniref:helix-turn-helix transcriptional regulator n=1 Tax=unclassified Mesorhizobium TaxID=325217 RepID=UPI0003CE59F0|nr:MULTISPECIES: helix-turn-helix transcriptional regulator [unclassified Mesorhizobium]ESY51888.1 DNA-binding protein [Mesorhizobium sp. LNJC374B00]ESY55923.1 DNA-binding protein [Mesorhizobium sp. LNJC372A00]WJI81261.1 helix-turn-helix domain-containing protein [Mesorhizobium sp. C374B]WJI87780.1 helix-turn-helix domain-containing protein [Mesorhizobium sp. C372A]